LNGSFLPLGSENIKGRDIFSSGSILTSKITGSLCYTLSGRLIMWQQSREGVENKMRELLRQEPKETDIQIDSQTIYDWLTSKGVIPADGEMESVFNSFKREGLIKGVGFAANGDERRKHGNFQITRISKWL
jgi:hypothetical protein